MLPILILCLAIALVVFAGAIIRRNARPVAVNSISPHATGRPTYTATSTVAKRYLIVSPDTLPGVKPATGAEQPLGIALDELTDQQPVTVALFGVASGTLTVRAGAAVAAGASVVSDASGDAITLPSSAGTYYIIGTALTAAGAEGDPIELQHCYPVKVTVS